MMRSKDRWGCINNIKSYFFKSAVLLFVAVFSFVMIAAPVQAIAPVLLAGSDWFGGKGVNVCDESTETTCGGETHVGGAATNWWQCVELAQRFYKAQGWHGGIFAGVSFAYQIYDNAASLGMTKQANGSITSIVPGDMIVHDSDAPYSGGAGHVSIVDHITDSTVYVVEQNTSNDQPRATYSLANNTLTRANTGTIKGVVHDPSNTITNTPGQAGPVNSFRPAVVQRPSGETDVAVVGPGNSLAFYYTVGNNWGGGVIPGSEAYSTPAMIQRPSGETIIAVRGANNSLLYYFNTQGDDKWNKLVVPGAVAYSAPAIVQRPSGEIDIAVQGANNTLAFYYTIPGAPHFAGGSIPGTQAYGEPAMIQRLSGETDIAVQGAGNSMNMYFNTPGFNNWGTSAVAAPGWALSAPSIVQRQTGETDIAVQGPNNSLDFYINAQSTNVWGRIPAGGAGTTFNAPNPPAMVLRSNGEANIAVKGPGDRADFYFNAPNSPNWGSIPAAVSGYAFRAPAMIQRPTTGETDLVIIGPNNRLDFYFNTLSSPYWSNIPIAGSNSAS